MDSDEKPISFSSSPAKLKLAGAWSGVLDVDLSSWTVLKLRDEVARRSGTSRDRINLICGGKILKDGNGVENLSQLGLKNNSKVLTSVVSADRGKALNDEAAAQADRSQKLARLRAAALALAGRHADGSLPVEDFNIELEDQNGQKVNLGSETDQKGIMMGLMLHANARSLMKNEKYKDALDVLSMAEEAFSLCDPKFIEMIDNVPILQLDTVWCYFMLRDISCLSVAGVRLSKARQGFERSHGKDSTRLRLLQSGQHAELALYLRLELLEGVVAYHSGNYAESRKALNSAQAKYLQLQIPDESLSLLMNMGYKEGSVKRALRMTGQDIQSAVDFLIEERAKKVRRHEEDLQRQKEIMEQKKYGRTPQKKALDLQMLNELVSIGFERCLAAEALRINENNFQEALDHLTDAQKNCDLQQRVHSRNMRMEQRETAAAMNAVNTSTTGNDGPTQAEETISFSDEQNHPITGAEEGSSEAATEDPRDEEMEDALAKELTGDALADYDIEVTKEGEAIKEYLALLESI
ncbi:putative Ubiquitin-like domain, UBA-like superfamily, Ubiquitin-associated domain-containing protein [Dioscorea sansibarensis]